MWEEIAGNLNLDSSKWVLLEQQQWPQLLLELETSQREETQREFELSHRTFFGPRFHYPSLLVAGRQAKYDE